MSTSFHAKYYAHELTRRCSAHQLDKLNKSILNASVDLNPHQLDAAMFAFRSPLSRGAILADEVGLGKTIEAGLIISQLWAERKRRILVIVPASLRKQWERELLDKFYIGSAILETRNHNRLVREGNPRPFEQTDQVLICSYNFARAKADDLSRIAWDLVVIDEAHRLRNVYKQGNKIARAIRDAIGSAPKVLLTATPLQNNLLELHGLVSFLDPHVFGSVESFREQFIRIGSWDDQKYHILPAKTRIEMVLGAIPRKEVNYDNLRVRLQPFCQRTLRRQVTEYIHYTNRISLTQDFTPTNEEVRLYESVSAYLQRGATFALPSSQRALLTLVMRKILASSSFAITATLARLIERLEAMGGAAAGAESAVAEVADDFELTDELADEWEGEEDEFGVAPGESGGLTADETKARLQQALNAETRELKSYKALAESIVINAKGEALTQALDAGFRKLAELGAARKALIFTESRRTQRYLYEHLERHGYAGQVVMLNGTNTEPESAAIYRSWLREHEGEDIVTGSKPVDIRGALVEEFERRKSVMIATESGAEGLNLQFCSLVVNYDLPWNPQRIEQRIGRCHRYGQQYDVVVINFINRRNEADRRVFELLDAKLRLFSGVFGASDEVLGALESGVDFEKRINAIYQTCRSAEEINGAFDRLQTELDEQIQTGLRDAHAKLMEHFDAEVHDRLRLQRSETDVQIGNFEKWLWRLTQYELADCAEFQPDRYSFTLNRVPDGVVREGIATGNYLLVTHRNGTGMHHYRLGHPLAERLIARARDRRLSVGEVVFTADTRPRVTVVEQLRDRSGWLRLTRFSVTALEQEDHLVFAAVADNGETLPPDVCRKLFSVDGTLGDEVPLPIEMDRRLQTLTETEQNGILGGIGERNRSCFETESEKLDRWADDLKNQLETELRDLDREIKEAKQEARREADLDRKLAHHKRANALEADRKTKRRSLFDAQDEVERRKDALIEEIEAKLKQTVETEPVFMIHWRVK